jgi:hypothetical protein
MGLHSVPVETIQTSPTVLLYTHFKVFYYQLPGFLSCVSHYVFKISILYYVRKKTIMPHEYIYSWFIFH